MRPSTMTLRRLTQKSRSRREYFAHRAFSITVLPKWFRSSGRAEIARTRRIYFVACRTMPATGS